MIEPLRRGVRVWVSSLEQKPPEMANNKRLIDNRRCGAAGAGTVTCVFPDFDTYYVLHDDKTTAPYKRAELTIEEARRPHPEFDPSTSDGPFPQPAPAA